MKYELINYCEFDKAAVQSFCAIHNENENKNLGDITKIDIEKLEQCDLITTGSPCQSFSFIGKQEGADENSGTKSSLMWYNIKVTEKCNPSFVIWENVKAVLSPKNKHNFDKYIQQLDELGYNSYYKILNAKDFNVPQNRERIFVVSIKKDIDVGFEFPNSDYSVNLDMFNYLDENVDNKYIVPQNCMIGYKGKKSIFKKRFILKKPGDCAYCLVAKSGRAVITNNYILNNWNDYKTLPCKLNDLDYLTDNHIPIRALTPLEYFKLQHFSELDYNKCIEAKVSEAQIYKQAGNSINVKVVETLFEQLKSTYPTFFKEEMKVISLFTGIGAFEKALQKI